MAVTFEQVMDILSRDIFTGERRAPDFSVLFALTCGDYQKWLRRAIRENGRGFQVGDAQHSPVDVFLSERTGFKVTLGACDCVDVDVNRVGYKFASDAATIVYYRYTDENEFVVSAGEALKYAMCEDASTLLVVEQ
jgi:hypothetical protein